jgi:hypothetical protein
MTVRASRRLAWSLCALAIASAVGVVVLDVLDRTRIHSLHDAQPGGVVLAVSFSLLGATIVSRRGGNRIGWIYLLIGVLMPWPSLGVLYYERSVVSGGLPGARWAAWASNWVVVPVFPAGLSLFAFLLFPSGRLPSLRWRPLAWSAVAVTSLIIALTWIDPTPIVISPGLPPVANPIGIRGLGSNIAAGAGGAAWFVGLALITAAIGGLVMRGRLATARERQQVKLLAYSAALTIGFLLVVTAVSASSSWWDAAVVLGFGVAVPVAVGVAILKHGLYEIDRLISRSLSYLILSGLLVGVFVGIVVVATRVLPFSSPVAVAASTLAAAALFNPLRRRVQRLVDRRFNRARYDAEASIAALTAKLRDAVDLETVQADLLDGVHRALAPRHASVWIRPRRP